MWAATPVPPADHTDGSVGKANPYPRQAGGRFGPGPGTQHTRSQSREDLADLLAGKRQSPVVVATLPDDIGRYFGTHSRKVLLSEDTVSRHAGKHGWTVSLFNDLQPVLDKGKLYADRERHILVIEGHQSPMLAVLKVTENGREVYLQSYYRTNERQMRNISERIVSISRDTH